MSALKAINVRNKVQALQNKLSCVAKQSLDRKFGALYDKVYRKDVLMVAWQRVRKNKGAPGVDEQDFEYIEEEIGVECFLEKLHDELKGYTYRSTPVLRCWIDKPGKLEKRPLGIPIIKDRVAQMAAKLILEPIFETNFLGCSHGFRPQRSQHTAIEQIRCALTFKTMTQVIDADIRGCFTNINHSILIKLIKKRITDPHLIRLIKGWLKAGVMDAGVYVETMDIGTPQGGVISPLLSNIYLHSFDKMFEQSGINGILVRYADDFVILLKDNAKRVLCVIRALLKRLGLELHSGKTRIVSAKKGFNFLSAHFRVTPVLKRVSRLKESCKLWPSNEAIQRIKQKIRDRIGRRYSLSLEEMIQELNPVIRGWNNYHQYKIFLQVEQKRFKTLNYFVLNRLRIFLKRKYSDSTMGLRRVSDNLPEKLGLCQFGL